MLQAFVLSAKKALGSQEIGASYSFRDISLTLKNGKPIPHPQSGQIGKASLWGVMCASGAGKTEFLPARNVI